MGTIVNLIKSVFLKKSTKNKTKILLLGRQCEHILRNMCTGKRKERRGKGFEECEICSKGEEKGRKINNIQKWPFYNGGILCLDGGG
jgi:hypothetical protein